MLLILSHRVLNLIKIRINVSQHITGHTVLNPPRLFLVPVPQSVSRESKWFPSNWQRVIPSLLHMWKRLELHIWKTPTARQKKVKLLQISKLLMQNSSCPTQIASKLRWAMSSEKKEHFAFAKTVLGNFRQRRQVSLKFGVFYVECMYT